MKKLIEDFLASLAKLASEAVSLIALGLLLPVLTFSKLLPGLLGELLPDDMVFLGLLDFSLTIFYLGGLLDIKFYLLIVTLLKRFDSFEWRLSSFGSYV